MWKRDTWHACAGELRHISERFIDAHWGRGHGGTGPRTADDIQRMQDASIDGVAILKSLALSVRSEMDFGIIPDDRSTVGRLMTGDIDRSNFVFVKQNHGFIGLEKNKDFGPIGLRESLNKIAHADPRNADYYVGAGRSDMHDLILQGTKGGRPWLAVISLHKLIDAIIALPDFEVVDQ